MNKNLRTLLTTLLILVSTNSVFCATNVPNSTVNQNNIVTNNNQNNLYKNQIDDIVEKAKKMEKQYTNNMFDKYDEGKLLIEKTYLGVGDKQKLREDAQLCKIKGDALKGLLTDLTNFYNACARLSYLISQNALSKDEISQVYNRLQITLNKIQRKYENIMYSNNPEQIDALGKKQIFYEDGYNTGSFKTNDNTTTEYDGYGHKTGSYKKLYQDVLKFLI